MALELETGKAPLATPRRKDGFTPARVIAFVVMGLLVVGLLYLRFAGEGPVEVPVGAEAGDSP